MGSEAKGRGTIVGRGRTRRRDGRRGAGLQSAPGARGRGLVGLALALCLLAGPVAADLIEVDMNGGADFGQITLAVAAAAEGDVILVQPGTYAGFDVDGKSLTIAGLGATASHVQVLGTTTVRNIAAGQSVLIDNVSLRGTPGAIDPRTGTALVIESSDGTVRIQGCFTAGGQLGSPFDDGGPSDGGTNGGPSAPAVKVDCSHDVVFVATGGEGALGPGAPGEPGGIGGPGLRLSESTVALIDGGFAGGFGGGADQFGVEVGGRGGYGVELIRHSTLYGQGTRILGGTGGWSGFGQLATGGDGLRADSTSVAILRDTQLEGGFGAFDVGCNCNGPSGDDFTGAGTLVIVPGSVPVFSASPDVVAGGGTLTLDGDAPALVLASLEGTLTYVLGQKGPLTVASPWIGDGILLPILPVAASVPALPPGVDPFVLQLQTITADGLGFSRSVVFVDALP